MTKEELEKLKEYFIEYSEDGFIEYFFSRRKKAKWFMHNWVDFIIVVFENGGVFQGGTEGDRIGIELKTFEDLEKRFESFVGKKIDF